MPLPELLANTALQGFLIAALVFLARTIILHWLNKDVESFKATLTARADYTMETFKAELARAAHEHQIQFAALHQRRADAIEALYFALVNARDTMERLVISWDKRNEGEFSNAAGEFVQLRRELALKRIYLPRPLCDELSHCIQAMWAPTVTAGVWAKVDNPANREKAEKAYEEAQAAIEDNGPVARAVAALEQQCRLALGDAG